MYNTGNIVNDTVKTLHGDSGNRMYHGDRFVTYKNIKLLWCTSEANKIFYVNYTSIESINKRKQVEKRHRKLNK